MNNSTNNQPEKLVLYRRLSKQKDARLGGQYGFDSQQWDFDNYLASNPNHEVVGNFGEFFSGRGDFRKRPEFMKALALCKRENATLVVTKIDRFSRDVESGSHLLNNYKVVVTSQPEADKMMLHILLTVSQNESDQISKRTKAALASAKRKGVKLGSANAKWQEANKDVVRRLNDTTRSDALNHAEKLRREVEMMVSMKFSFDTMANKLKELDKKTSKGKPYTAGSVRNLCGYLNITGKTANERYESLMA